MQINEEHNALFSKWLVNAWNNPISDSIMVLLEKYDAKTGTPAQSISIHIGSWRTDTHNARLYAEAILKACEIAEKLRAE